MHINSTGFFAKDSAPILSHHSTGTDSTLIPNSLNKDYNQINSVVVDASALYSTSILDLVTTCCFFELQLIRFPPKKDAAATCRPSVINRAGPICIRKAFQIHP